MSFVSDDQNWRPEMEEQILPAPTWELPAKPDELLNDLTNKVEEAQDAKDVIESTWEEHQDYVNGDMWKDFISDPPWVEEEQVTLNLIRQTINVVIPILLDTSPTWYVAAYDENHDDVARSLQIYLQSLWHEMRIHRELEKVYKNALIFGTGALKVFQDQTWLRGATPASGDLDVGHARVAYISPYSIFPDPDADSLEDCSYVALRNVMHKDLVERVWPTADMRIMEREAGNERKSFFEGAKAHYVEDQYQVWEVYHDFGEKLTIYSGREMLWTGDNPTPGFKYPVVLFHLDERETDIWGPGYLDAGGKELHDGILKLLWRINIHQRLSTNPSWTKSGPGGYKLDNAPGGVHTLNHPQAALTPNVPPNLPTYVMNLLQFYLNMWENWTGVQPAIMGQRPPGITTGVAISNLQEAAQTRLRQIIRSFQIQLAEVGQLLLDLLTHYSVRDLVGFLPDDQPRRATVSAKNLRDMDNRPIPFRVLVAPSSDIPMSQAQLAQTVMALAPTGMIDQQMILDALRLPGRQAMMERMRQAAQAQLASAAQEETAAHIRAELERERLNSTDEMPL